MNLESLKLGDVIEAGPFFAFAKEEVTLMVTKVSKWSSGLTLEFDASYFGIHLATVLAISSLATDGIKWEVKK